MEGNSEKTSLSEPPENLWRKLGGVVVASCRLIWGFTESDFPTFVVPNSAFGLLAALAAGSEPLVHTPFTLSSPTWRTVLPNLPAVLLFNWWHTLLFDVSHQWGPASVAEDRLNKPWRPIPAGKVTGDQARRGLLALVPLSLALDHGLGVWDQGLLIHVLTWLYNDLGGCDEAFFVRDLCTASAFAMFNSGALKIASGCHLLSPTSHDPGADQGLECTLSGPGRVWTALVSAVIFTTMQVQDLKDQAGDRLRGRRTVVLRYGEGVARGSIAVLVVFWSLVCGCFWGPSWRTLALPLLPALVVVWKVTRSGCTRAEDRRTWQLWSLWLVCLYVLPVFGTN